MSRQAEKKRQNNFEALRMLAMFMVIVLHYLDKGNILTSAADVFQGTSYLAWFIESFAIVAVNVYVLITGYFMCESSMKPSRLLQIICQVWWYALLVPVILCMCGIVDIRSFQLYDILQFVFPIHMKHYWFVTAYVVLMLFVPFLNMGIRYMSKIQLAVSIVLMSVYQMFPKSVLPVKFTEDDAGNGVLWLICLYLIAAYIRKYGIAFFSSAKKSILCYIAGSVSIFASLLVMRKVYFALDAFGESLSFGYHYNHILCLFASVSLFYAVKYWNISEGVCSRLIGKLAPYTFGVYLLHEHILVRYRWVAWLQVQPDTNVFLFVGKLLVKCLLVLAVGILADWIREKIFYAISRMFLKTPLHKGLERMDQIYKVG